MKNDLNTKTLFVTIVGNPNVGKSSILNMVINSKISIVSPKPQTTRNKITGIFTQNDTQLVFTDTPGLHRPHTRLGNYMVSEINNSFAGAEACIHVVDATNKVSENDNQFIEKFKKINIPIILVINKIDLIKDKTNIIKIIKEYSELFEYESIIPISAKTGEGKDELLNDLFKLAKPSVFFFSEDDITDQTERMLTSEIIREKLLMFLDKELPHGTAVYIERFRERNNSITDIDAVIYCERENHKGIIIGKNGQLLKRVGTAARIELENILDKKINLKLWVKVKENWRNKSFLLNNLGYRSEED